MKLRNLVVVLSVGVGALAITAGQASAYVACNRAGDCWHTNDRDFQHGWGITVHPDNWHWRGHHYRWREHEGRGYWRNGVWITF